MLDENREIIINIENLSKFYDNKKIFDRFDLKLFKGEVSGLVGLNGSGKTSLIKLILDLIDLDEGKIIIDHLSHKSYHSRKNLAYLPEKFSLPPSLSGEEFLKFSLSLDGEKYDQNLAEKIMKELDFSSDLMNFSVGSYSKGTSQKLGLISIFMSKKSLIILDEPMSGLDLKSRKGLKNLIKFYNQNYNTTIFFTTHILSDLEELCSYLYIIDKFEMRFSGKMEDFLGENQSLGLEKIFFEKIL